MKVGNLVTYFFSGRYPYTGIVMKKWKVPTRTLAFPIMYEYTVEILENTGNLSTFDVYEGDKWEVLSEKR